MTAAVTVMNHPTDQTLAAFVDGTLPTPERQEVIKHMAECAECRDVVLLTTEIKAAEAPVPAKVAAATVLPWRPKRWLPLAAAAAIAGVVAMPNVRVAISDRLVRREVAAASNKLEKRQTEGRLSLDAGYKSFKGRPRGGEADPETLIEVARFKMETVTGERATAANLHALGLAYLLEGKHAQAIEALTKASDEEESADRLNDLAAAYLESGDYERALKAAERSLQLEHTPEGAWNRALALERLDRTAEAKAAWHKYLELDPNSKWADEVRGRYIFDE